MDFGFFGSHNVPVNEHHKALLQLTKKCILKLS